MTEAHDIARQTAQRLTARYGKDLPMAVEKAIISGEQPGKYVSVGDLASVASLIVSIAALAWQIWRDTRASGKTPDPDAIGRELRLKNSAPKGVDAAARDQLIAIIVVEVMKDQE